MACNINANFINIMYPAVSTIVLQNEQKLKLSIIHVCYLKNNNIVEFWKYCLHIVRVCFVFDFHL